MAKSNYEFGKYSMQDKYQWHSNRAFENRKPKGSHMSKAELAAFSAGYTTHAKQVAGAFIYNNPNYKAKTEYGKMAAKNR